MEERRRRIAYHERLDVQELSLSRLARKLTAEGRLHPQAMMALQMGLACLQEALDHPELTQVGAGLIVTVDNPKPCPDKGHTQEEKTSNE